jgi:hypothetical protein
MARLLLRLFFTYFSFVGANWVYHPEGRPEARDYLASDERFNQPCIGNNLGASQYFPNVIIDTVLPTNPDGVLDAMYTDREPVMNFWQRDQGFAGEPVTVSSFPYLNRASTRPPLDRMVPPRPLLP